MSLAAGLAAYLMISLSDMEVSVQETQPPTEARAKELYAAGRYFEAAVAYEGLWNSDSLPKYLFNAAMAHELSGREGKAYLLLKKYLSLPKLQPAEIEKASARLDALKLRASPLQIQVDPASPVEGMTLKKSGVSGDADLVIDSDSLALCASKNPGTFEFYLEPGTWTIVVKANGYKALGQDVAIREGERPQVLLRLVQDRPAVIPLATSFGPAAAVTAGIRIKVRGVSGEQEYTVPGSGNLTLELPVGKWNLQALAPGFKPVQVELVVDGSSQTHAITMEAVSDPSSRTNGFRDAFGKGLQGGGGLLLGVGAGLTVASVINQPFFEDFRYPCGDSYCLKSNALPRQGVALALRESGVLLATFGATTLVYGTILRHRNVWKTWKPQLAVGVSLVVIGGVTSIVAHEMSGGLSTILRESFPDISRERFRGLHAADTIGFALVGTGLALSVWGPVSTFFAQRGWNSNRLQVMPSISPTRFALGLRMSF